jgi:hypothetical protein
MANANKSICIIVIELSFRLVFAKREQGGQGRIQSPAAATGKQPKESFLIDFYALSIILLNRMQRES